MHFIKILFLISFSFGQHFINPQRLPFNLIKWEEIRSDSILINKVGPIVNTSLPLLESISFFNSNIIENGIISGNIFPEISISSRSNPRQRFFGSAVIKLNNNISIQNDFEFDNNGKNDSNFQGIERGLNNGWVGYMQHSSLTYFYPKGHISLGRGNPYFFNMNESLLFNSKFPPVEFLWWQNNSKWLQFDWGLLLLDKLGSSNRFITFHRYGINTSNLRFGFSEAIMAEYEYWSASELGYIMPASVLLETEENRGVNANLMWLIDGTIKWDQWIFYGELLIDDFAIDGKSPPQIAISAGFGKKINKLSFNIDYVRVNRWTGNYCDSFKQWSEKGVPIGHSIGSDAHNLSFSSFIYIDPKLAVELSFDLFESGMGSAIERLNDWPENVLCETNFGYNSELFPSSSNMIFLYEMILFYKIKNWIFSEFHMNISDNMPPDFLMVLNINLNSIF